MERFSYFLTSYVKLISVPSKKSDRKMGFSFVFYVSHVLFVLSGGTSQSSPEIKIAVFVAKVALSWCQSIGFMMSKHRYDTVGVEA